MRHVMPAQAIEVICSKQFLRPDFHPVPVLTGELAEERVQSFQELRVAGGRGPVKLRELEHEVPDLAAIWRQSIQKFPSQQVRVEEIGVLLAPL